LHSPLSFFALLLAPLELDIGEIHFATLRSRAPTQHRQQLNGSQQNRTFFGLGEPKQGSCKVVQYVHIQNPPGSLAFVESSSQPLPVHSSKDSSRFKQNTIMLHTLLSNTLFVLTMRKPTRPCNRHGDAIPRGERGSAVRRLEKRAVRCLGCVCLSL
jgi:hypothetical protein